MGFLNLFLNKTKPLSLLEKSCGVSHLLEQFPTRWDSSPGGKMLPLACEGCHCEKERKNQNPALKTTVCTSEGEWK